MRFGAATTGKAARAWLNESRPGTCSDGQSRTEHLKARLAETAAGDYRLAISLFRDREATQQHVKSGLKGIGTLPNLEYLDLGGTHVTGAGLVHLRNETRLTYLLIGRTDIGDSDLRHIGGLTQMRCLDLRGTKISDAGLVYLKGMTQLENLRLEGTGVSREGVENLRRDLPKVQVVWP